MSDVEPVNRIGFGAGGSQDKIILEKPWEVREKGRVVCRMRVTPQTVKLAGSFSMYFSVLMLKNEIDHSIF